MSVKIRLFRMGRKKKAMYRIVVIDSRKARNSEYIEKIGLYNPLTEPATVEINKEKVFEWLSKGAIPSETVFNLFQKEGIALEYHLIKNNVDEKARNIEIQKWELSKKVQGEEKTLAEAELNAKIEAEAEVVEEVVVEETEEKVVEEPTEETTEEPTEESTEESTEE